MRKVKEKKEKRGTAIFFAVLRIIAALACGFLLYTFVFTMSLNQVNHGNVLGSIYCVGVILIVILYPALRKHRKLRTTARVIGSLQLAFAIFCGVISLFILSEMRTGENRAVAASTADGGTRQTVIVLGCKTIDGEPSPMLALRLDKAIEYLNAHPSAVCITSGGMGSDEIAPEAFTMRKYLIRNGIAESRIIIEPDSENTEQNIKNSAKLIAEQNLPRSVVIVSECYHIFRGVRQAKLAGLDAAGIYPDPASVIITMPSYWLREIFAVTRDFVCA